jgi:hypothetical protein
MCNNGYAPAVTVNYKYSTYAILFENVQVYNIIIDGRCDLICPAKQLGRGSRNIIENKVKFCLNRETLSYLKLTKPGNL